MLASLFMFMNDHTSILIITTPKYLYIYLIYVLYNFHSNHKCLHYFLSVILTITVNSNMYAYCPAFYYTLKDFDTFLSCKALSCLLCLQSLSSKFLNGRMCQISRNIQKFQQRQKHATLLVFTSQHKLSQQNISDATSTRCSH